MFPLPTNSERDHSLTYRHSEALEKKKAKRRKTHLIVWISGTLIVAIIIAVAIIGWWFSQGPGDN